MQRLFPEAHSKRTKQCNMFRKGNFYYIRKPKIHEKWLSTVGCLGVCEISTLGEYSWERPCGTWSHFEYCLALGGSLDLVTSGDLLLVSVSLRSTLSARFLFLCFLNLVWNSLFYLKKFQSILCMLQSLFIFPPSDNEIPYLRGVDRRLSVKSCWLNCYSIKRWDSV